MNVRIGVGSSSVVKLLAAVARIICKPTTRSRDISGAREKETLFGTNREASKPPNVKLP